MLSSLQGRRIVLASSSPRRLDILRSLGLEPIVQPVNVAEQNSLAHCSAQQAVTQNAQQKAEAGCTGYDDHIIIAADTMVVFRGRAFTKPRDAAEAVHTLTQLSGQTHSVYTGMCLIDTRSGHSALGHRVTTVRFCALSAEVIARYVDSGEPLDKAGCYGIQGLGGLFVEAIEGDYGTVVGLSLPLLRDLAQQLAGR